jgi:hypothetical protein
VSGENWVLITLIATVGAVKTVTAILRYKGVQRAADRKAGGAS